ncbi:LysR family transcriptional regulator [Rhizobium sp. C1]|uniref:LysR family transcriptional regulator n=1 Tax=Rhizobium sp. C1 TaxID=1349799 RepID=UPI001E4537B3|nr:LysR family transcriptional regulator [Rhizobium sp. C1]MCD2176660.1 LysR substrate-binding domain-containing protein [Rhizobium sp. C1]
MDEPRRENLPLLELDILRTFVAIADTGNFTTAAEAVLRTPSAVSMQIKKLEEMLGATLFRRDARTVTLTHHGEVLLTSARRILAMNNEIVGRFVRPHMNGVVNLGAPDDIGDVVLPEVLRRFAEAYPLVAVDVRIEGSEALRRQVSEGKLDIALFNCTAGNFSGEGELLYREKLVWAGKKCGSAYARSPVPVSVWEAGCIWRSKALDALEKSGHPYRIAYLSAHHMGQRAAIRADIAIAPLARFLIADDMVELGEAHGLPDIGYYDVGMAMRTGAPAPVDALADYIRAAVASIGKSVEMAA